VLPAEASEHLGEAQGGDGLLLLSLCGSAWTCFGCKKCRIDIFEARFDIDFIGGASSVESLLSALKNINGQNFKTAQLTSNARPGRVALRR
jgi:hypothetical protein